MNQTTTHDVLATLQWYAEAGVDMAIADEPVNWFELPKPSATSASHTAAKPATQPAGATPASAPITAPAPKMAAPAPHASQGTKQSVSAAIEAAKNATTLAELHAAIEAFDGCALKKLATNTVFATGCEGAPIMLIGEAPDADDDRAGSPFNPDGACGQLLDKMLAAIELTRAENAYLSHAVFWRPPGNRQPTTEEIAVCRPFVEKHIAIAKPKLLVLVGGCATKSLLNENTGIAGLRGVEHQYQNDHMDAPIPAYALLHPTYLMRQPAHKALAWKDLLHIKHHLQRLRTP